MKLRSLMTLAAVSGSLALLTAASAATVGQPAPQFAATDSHGNTVSLDSLRGRYVVLEWFNPTCPFVRKHYDSGNMQALQKAFGGNGVTWLAVKTMQPGSYGYVDPAQANAWLAERQAAPAALLLDPDAKVARLYAARVTPHMFVIDPQGQLIYAGAIDDRRSTSPADVAGATNYVKAALDEAMAGRPVTTASTQAYGCTVRYPRAD
ncbi:MAG TPA: redoxin domain-containing protein [Burkholderiaceae bacterium]|nr:redoxin domain-containing protein [Burkholderiaceae bacterium]